MKRTEMPARKKPMARGKGLARSRRSIAPRNRKRSTAALDQDFGEEAKTVRALPCLVAGCCVTPVEPAHVKSRGAGGGRFDIVPLCHAHHREQHSRGIRTFAKIYGFDLRLEADRVALEHSEPLGIRGLARDYATGEVVTDHTADALLGWVRRALARETDRLLTRARTLSVAYGEDSVLAVGARFEARDREALAHAVMLALGEPFTSDPHGEHGLAWSLCEIAGWPS
jgi:hypothetical protein